MVDYQHPGLYIQEVPSVPTIQSASTSVPAFIGVTEKGNANVPTLITSWGAYQQNFGGLAWGAYVPWSVYEFFAEGGGRCYVINIAGSGAKPATCPGITGWTIQAASSGSWPNNLIYVAVRDVGPPLKVSGQVSPFFSVNVVVKKSTLDAKLKSNQLTAQILQAYIDNNALDQIPDGTDLWYVLESFGAYSARSLVSPAAGIPTPLERDVNGKSIFIRISISSNSPPQIRTFPPSSTMASGVDAVQDYSNIESLLAGIQGVALVSTPDIPMIGDAGKEKAAINSILNICEKENLFYVVDPDFYYNENGIDKVVSFKAGTDTTKVALESTHGAIYHPWVYVLDQATGANVPTPPSGAVLGRFAFTDNTIGVYKSPAGVRDGLMRTVTRLNAAITDSDHDVLNPNGINAIRSVINFGSVIYGARTLAVGSDYSYVSIRRFVSFVETSLWQSLQWVVFEPNSETLWLTVVREVTAFLTLIWQSGWIYGGTENEAFFVICDATNNPPESRRNGVLNVDVGLAVVYPAEFVVVRVTQKASGADGGS